MSTNRWRGDAPAVAQVDNFTVSATANGAVFTVTCNGKTVTYTAVNSDTTTTVATALLALLNATTIPEFQEVAWTSSTNILSGTAATIGKPFTITAGATGGGTFSRSAVVVSSGPNDVSVTKNWS